MSNLAPIHSRLKPHERWLIGLRRDSGKTLQEIRTELSEQKGIAVRDNQLEIYFRKLGQRKNLAQSEWRTVFHFLDSQRAFGRLYDLYISERLVPEKALQRNRRRIGDLHALASSLPDADRILQQLPKEVTVKPRGSPGPSIQHRINSQPVLEAGFNTNTGREPSVLHGSTSADNAELEPSASIPDVDASSSSIGSQPAITGILSAQVVDFSTTTEAHQILQNLDLPIHEIESGAEFDISNTSVADYREFSPSSSQLNLLFQDLTNQDDSMMGLPMPAECDYGSQASVTLMEWAQLLLRDFGSGISRRGLHGMNEQLPTAEELLDSLQSLVSIEDMGEFHEPLHVVGDNVLFTDQFVQLFLHATVNSFAGIDNVLLKVIMRFMNQHEPLRSSILSCLTKAESTTFSSALTEKLLKAAIEAGDAKTVQDLLALKVVKPDDIIFMEGKRRRTPLEKASTMHHFEIMELLLRFDADVNKTYVDTESIMEQGALECAIGTWGEYRRIDLKIVDLLLDHSATVSGRLAEAAIRWGDERLIEKLMSRFPPSEHVHCFSSSMLSDAAEYLKNNMGLKIVQQAIETCRKTHHSICVGLNQKMIAKVMMSAAKKENTELVRLLLPYGGQKGLDWALTGAVRSENHSLVHLLIEHGACADAPACRIDPDSPEESTPLAEAIRADDAELVELLAKEGAWNQIGEPDRRHAALRAVAQSGSLVYLDKILQLVPHLDPEAFALPLSDAIMADHEQFALKLIGLGADVNFTCEIRGPLFMSMRKRSQSIFWAILESDVEVQRTGSYLEATLGVAAEWGDPQVIKALVFMGADINGCTSKGQLPLVTAIRAGDKPLIKLLISLGANPKSRSGTMSPLAAAVLVQDEDTARYLLDHGADPADETAFINASIHDKRLLNLVFQVFGKQYPEGCIGFGGRVLHHALNTQDDALLELCLKASFDVNALTRDETRNETRDEEEDRKVSALGLAIKKYRGGRLELVRMLLDAGGDANIPASQGAGRFPFPSPDCTMIVTRQTAFLEAIETKSLPLVELLISKGANVHMEAKWGLKHTPLQKACEVSSHAIVDLFLEKGANVNEAPADRGGATALQLAAKAGSARIAKTLLAAGADVNAPGAQVWGNSAINYAAEYGWPNMIQLLWNAPGAGFTADICNSAIVVARDNGHPACADLIMKLLSESQTRA